MKIVDNKLAKRIRSAREDNRLSQVELAQAIGVSDKSISAYEKGRAIPPFGKLIKIATTTHRSLNYFTEENEDQTEMVTRLQSIENDLAEVKKLLRKRKPNS